MGDVNLAPVALIALALSFLAERIYCSYSRHGKIKADDVIMPALLSVGTTLILLFFFNAIGSGGI